MKEKRGLTMALLERHQTSSLKGITREMITTEDLKIINCRMSLDAKELIADASGHADNEIEPVLVEKDHQQFQKSGFEHATEDELLIIGRIYAVHGREIDITREGIVVHPRTDLQIKRKRFILSVG